MSFANHNILDIALSLIPPTIVQIRKARGTSDNAYGQVLADYSEWIEVYGIVQPDSETTEHINGMDISKKRVRIWLRGVTLTGVHIQEAPDQIRFVGRIYNVVDVEDWTAYDNYRRCTCVEAVNIAPEQRGESSSSAGKKKGASTKTTKKTRKTKSAGSSSSTDTSASGATPTTVVAPLPAADTTTPEQSEVATPEVVAPTPAPASTPVPAPAPARRVSTSLPQRTPRIRL